MPRIDDGKTKLRQHYFEILFTIFIRNKGWLCIALKFPSENCEFGQTCNYKNKNHKDENVRLGDYA